jgi:hypothetical protein
MNDGHPPSAPDATPAERLAQAADRAPPSLAREFLDFLLHNKKWWLTPILLMLLAIGLLALAAGTGAGPFIYALY